MNTVKLSIFTITLLSTLGIATQTYSKSSDFGASFGGGAIGGFAGSMVGSAISQPRRSREPERVVYTATAQHTDSSSRLERKIRGLEEEVICLQSEIRLCKRTNNALKVEVDELREQNRRLKIERDAARKECAVLTCEVNELHTHAQPRQLTNGKPSHEVQEQTGTVKG